MKATILAKFFDILSRQQILFSVDEFHKQSFKDAFGISDSEEGSDKKANGVYLQVWTVNNSFCDDIVTEFLEKNMKKEYKDGTISIYNESTNDVGNNDWLYIIKIED